MHNWTSTPLLKLQGVSRFHGNQNILEHSDLLIGVTICPVPIGQERLSYMQTQHPSWHQSLPAYAELIAQIRCSSGFVHTTSIEEDVRSPHNQQESTAVNIKQNQTSLQDAMLQRESI